MKKFIFFFLSLTIISGCDLISNSFDYKERTEEFVEAVLDENYDRCLEIFAMDHAMATNTDREIMKANLKDFRILVTENFGTDLEYDFMKSEKTWSTVEENNHPPNTTVVYVQYSNESDFGVFRVLYDDTSKKILNINAMDVKEPIPQMATFWLFGLIVICVPIFNIYVIWLIKKSNLRKKWLKYLAILVFNVPAITYGAIGGFSFDILSFQFLLGMSFSYMGYLNTAWTIGIPLGGIFWLWKIKSGDVQEIHSENTVRIRT